MLTDEQITKYQALYRSRFGCDISRDEALEKGVKLVRLLKIIYQPMTVIEHQQNNKAPKAK